MGAVASNRNDGGKFRPVGLYFLSLLILLALADQTWALAPKEVLVIANKNAAKSQGLAAYYMKKRGIPPENLVLLWITDKETCTRQDYEKKVIPPVRRFLDTHPEIRALVTLYGVPLKIQDNSPAKGRDKSAALDSELTLVTHKKYSLNNWQPNPFYLGFKNKNIKIPKADVMMVSRLDGPSDKIVRRIINDSIEAELSGLKGTAYFDARWALPQKTKGLKGYAFYDKSLHQTARFHEKNKILPVVLNQSQDLFTPGQAPNAAIYCGWYSLGNYIDAFKWSKGSVGYHMASSECTTLKGKSGNTWCKKMLEKGIAATIGPVGEPYIQAFPVPEIFFNFLTEGQLTLAEAYMVSLPFLSWKMILVGDPLYRVNINKE